MKRLAIATHTIILFCLASISGAELQGWIFPGDPACGARDTYTNYQIDVLKPQYFNVEEDGSLTVGPSDSCNGYTPENVADVKAYSKRQFATTACQYTGFNALIHDASKVQQAISTFLATMQSTGMTGVEIDCENYEQWTSDDRSAFISFLTQLGDTLHAHGFQLMIDGPAIDTADTQGGVPNFRYEDYADLAAVDYVCVMAYDNQLGDGGTGGAVSPDAWLIQVVDWIQGKITNSSKVVIGIGSYGYHGPVGQATDQQVQDTKEESSKYSGYETAQRDSGSGEMMWTQNGIFYDYADTTTLDHRRSLLEKQNVQHISVWHLGGNDWFSGSSTNNNAADVEKSASIKLGANMVITALLFAVLM
eukprot:TRINITY_DN1768_c0_g1_i1.p1 TRINITY_DN1768_c0_g1~~TRINITY_DN1768_c0_g1_i1.p1  ORF type:complete len:380 (-),score=98.17 TRINITY_DN1768_c0_g1_i1:19-1107(-)